MAEVGVSEGTIAYYLHFFKKKEKRKQTRKKNALGTFYASLSQTGQSQDSVRYFKRVVKEFILLHFV